MADYGDQVFAAEAITKKRFKKGKVEYLVKWKGKSNILASLVFNKQLFH